MKYRDLVEMLQCNTLGSKGVRFIYGESKEKFMTYNQLFRNSLKALNFFQKNGLTKNDEVIIYTDDNLSFLYCFWGCVLGGIVPVPISVSNSRVIKEKITKVLNTLNRPKIITDTSLFEDIDDIQGIKSESILNYNDIDLNGDDGIIAAINPEDIAFIQFSSGSTSDPKGVVLTHENLITNLNAIILGSKLENDDATISWMPLTHDMGLIGFHLAPMYAKIDQLLMPPSLFIRNPLLYLAKSKEHHSNILCSPNFGIKHILKFIERKKNFREDLSHVKLLFNGAEPISYDLCQKFINNMASYNLKDNILFPVYGMAEASLAITFPRPGDNIKVIRLDRNKLSMGEKISTVDENYENFITFVKVGKPVNDCEVLISDNEGIPIGEDIIGSIFIRGENVTRGYYNNEVATNKAINANGWLDTGDLGFINEGELVITGRKKDIIFINGQNYYPHDIEMLIEDLNDPKIKDSAACGVPNRDKEDEIVLFISSKYNNRDFAKVAQAIKKHVSKIIESDVKIVIPVASIPKTTSGKSQRYKLVENYINGTYDEYIENHLQESLDVTEEILKDEENKVKHIFEEVLEITAISADKNFFEMGGNSLKAAHLISMIDEEFNIKLTIRDIFSDFTIKGVSKVISSFEKIDMPPLSIASDKEFYEVLPSHKKLSLLNNLENTKRLFNILKVFEIKGDIDNDRFRNALEKLTEVHESLRTNFIMLEGQVYQKIRKEAKINIMFHNLNSLDIERYINSFNTPFDLENDTLFKTAVIRSENKNIIIFCMHHIIVDGTSIGLLLNDLIKIYNGTSITKPKYTLKDYSVWRNAFKRTDNYQKQKKYWLDQFSEEIVTLDLPYDYNRPKNLNYRGNSFKVVIEPELTKKIKTFALNMGTTEYVTLFSIFNILVSKLILSNEFIIGTPVAARSVEYSENIIAMLMNTIPIKVSINTNDSIIGYLQKFQKNIFTGVSNCDYYCEDLIQDLNVKLVQNRNSFFDVVFNMQNMHLPKLNFDGFSLHEVAINSEVSKVDLTLDILPLNDRYIIDVEYSTELFKEETVRNILQKYLYIINKIVDKPDLLIKEVEIIDDTEKNKLLNVFNKEILADQFVGFKELFEDQVKVTPDNIALSYDDRFIDYFELNERANGIEQTLESLNSKGNMTVAILMESGIERGIVLIGCLKYGNAYLPIEHDNPIERINYMLKDSGASVLITDRELNEGINFSGEILKIEDINQIKRVKVNSIRTIDPNDSAYIIYTSGTTGMPKGVLVQQKNLSGYIDAFLDEFNLVENDRFLQQASYGFDAFVEEMYTVLTVGGMVCIAKKQEVKDIKLLIEKIKRDRVSIISASPLLINEINKFEFDSDIHTYISGGDVLKWEYIDNLISKANIYNTYGPTETTVCATYYKCKDGDQDNKIPIGKPIKNYNVYILNEDNKLCPIGVAGELCVSGIGVSKGYLNQEVLTKEKFVCTPFSREEKMYRTGDLAKWLPNGDIEYLGRIDNQVNIRGYRIELEEVEKHLLKLNGIEGTVVIDQVDEEDEKYLCAYIKGNRTFTVDEIKSFLRMHIPSYMIPSYFVQIESIPLTKNGKVDKKALGSNKNFIGSSKGFVKPRNTIEEKLATLWSELLKREHIGAFDDFFEIGGHSLKASVMAAEIKKEFNIDIPIGTIFQLTKLNELGEYISQAEKSTYMQIAKQKKMTFYEVSSAQKRLFALNQIDMDSTSYNITRVITIDGKIIMKKVHETFEKLIERHESLRTTFEIVDGVPVQKVHDYVDFSIEYINLNNQLVDDAIRDFIRPFKLDKAPVFRVGIIKLEETKHILVLDIHHIISDGVSISIMVKEFINLYANKKVDELPIQYKDYVGWESEELKSAKMKKQAEYWLNIFSKEAPVLNLSTDYTRPLLQSSDGNSLKFMLDKGVCQKLKRISSETGTTLFMVMLTAYNILLHKYTHMEDIVVGTVTAGRSHAQLKNVIGMFVNTLAIRNYPEKDKSFLQLLNEVKENTIKAFENQDYPFEELVSNLNLKRDTSRSALFDTMFVYQNMDMPELSVGDLKMSPYTFTHNTAMFDITLEANDHKDGIEFTLEYCSELFKLRTMERFARHYINILGSIIKSTEIKISEIDMLTGDEKDQILYTFNNTIKKYNDDICFHALFEEQVEKTPNNIAVVFENNRITYKELNEKANQVARYIRSKGVEADQVVGIMMERSLEMIIGIIGVLKAGGAYVPIDPALPKERIQYMLDDSKTQLLITQHNLISTDEFASISFSGIMCFLDDNKLFSGEYSNLTNVTTPNNLAYMIYTSGTTGKPKAVMIEHGSYVNASYAWRDAYKLDEMQVKLLQMASFSFDVFAGDVARALVNGGKLILCPDNIKFSTRELYELIKLHEINIFESTPALAVPFMEYIYDAQLDISCLNLLILGSDICNPAEFKTLLQRFGDQIRILNSYGVTEACIDSSFYEIETDEYDKNRINGSVPIGKPIANTQMYIVDSNLKLLPIGVIGELCIGGKGVARGYWNRDDLTKVKFVNNPFELGTKMYRSGDMARWLPDGNIEFLGRSDFQVKIRGYRIELGEIEAVLIKHPSIEDAVVVPQGDKEESSFLSAYIVYKEELEVADIKRYLAQYVPDYMIPLCFMQMDYIPLTSNGKVDRKALPKSDMRIELIEYEEPRNEVEKYLVDIWEQVLNSSKIGIDDNFFALGGDSIKAIRVNALLQKYNLKLQVKDLFLYPTIREISNHVVNISREAEQGIIEGLVPLTAIQQWFFLQDIVERDHWNQAVLVKSNNRLERDYVTKAIESIIMHHDALRMSYKICEDGVIQYNRGKEDKLFKIQTYKIDTAEEVKIIKEIEDKSLELHHLTNIEQGPLVAVGLFKSKIADYLCISIQHLVVDGVSWRIILEDFMTCYEQISQNETINLPKKTDSFKLWSTELQEYANSCAVSDEISYWNKLSNTDIAKLPKDNEIQCNTTATNKEAVMTLSKAESEKLLKKTSTAYNTETIELLLTALGLALQEWSGKGRYAIMLEGHGRENLIDQIDISRTVGWFTSVYPLVMDMTTNKDLSHYIKNTKESFRKIPNRGVGYGILKYITSTGNKRSLTKSMINPEISFNYLGEFDQSAIMKGMGMSLCSTSLYMSPQEEREYIFDINCGINNGLFVLTLNYNKLYYEDNTVDRFIDSYKDNLMNLIGHCTSKEETEMTPSDFDFSDFSIDDLVAITDEVDNLRE